MNKIIIIVIASIFLISCASNSESSTIDYGPFNITPPEGWKRVEFQGIDSYVGGLTNGTDTLSFDYGWYSYDFKFEDMQTHTLSTDTINGKIATIIKPKTIGKGTIGVYFHQVYKDNHFNLIGSNVIDEKIVLQIFQSIMFKDSDSTVNSINFSKNF
jgi:hypothetical protein